MNEIKSFRASILDYWLFVVLGSVIAAGLFVWTLFGGPVPVWCAGLLLAITAILAVYLAGRHEHLERLKLADQLRPKLSIYSVPQKVGDRWRIRICNLAEVTIRFGASGPGHK